MAENEITQIGEDLASESSILLTAVGDIENTTPPADLETTVTDPPVPTPAFNNISVDMIPYVPQSATLFAKVMSIKVSAEGERVENFALYDDGTMIAKNAQVAGIITAKGGKIGGWSISTNAIYNNSYRNGNSSKFVGMLYSTNSNDIAFGAGDFSSNGQCFYVTHNGNLYANNATIAGTVYASAGVFTGTVHANSGEFTGTITANSGKIGGWTINSYGITATNQSGLLSCNGFSIDNGTVTLGSSTGGSNQIKLSSTAFQQKLAGYGLVDLLCTINRTNDTNQGILGISPQGDLYCHKILFPVNSVTQGQCSINQSKYFIGTDKAIGIYLDTLGYNVTPTTEPDTAENGGSTGSTGSTQTTSVIAKSYLCFSTQSDYTGEFLFYPRLTYHREGLSQSQAQGGTSRILPNYSITKNEVMTPELLGLVDNNTVYKFKIASSGGGTAGYITFIV